MKRLLILLPFLLIMIHSAGQTLNDAIRFTSSDYNGTARHYATGSGMTALGGDFGAISVNPASLAVYRKSEFSLSTGFFMASTESQLNGDGNDPFTSQGSQFHLSNMGFVFSSQPRSRTLRTVNIAIGYNRQANLRNNINFQGKSLGSITDRFRERARGLTPNELNDFETGLAFDAGAIFDFDEDRIYESDFSFVPEAQVNKGQEISERGNMNDFFFALGMNFSDKFHFGLSIGLPSVNYEREKEHFETDPDDEIAFFEDLSFRENLTISGVGINAKLGATYLASQSIRLGAYVHTPTRYALQDEYSTEMSYQFDEGNGVVGLSASSGESTFDYQFISPWRFGGGIGVIVNRSGFISADVEYINYPNAKFDITSDDSPFTDEIFENQLNSEINTSLQNDLKIRLGGEWTFDHWRARLGYVRRGNPLESADGALNSYRTGIGYRGDSFYVDLAYSLTTVNREYLPYRTEEFFQPIVDQSNQDHLILSTVGFRF